MTKLLAILILTCATLHAQSVIVKGTGAGAVLGTTATTQVPVSVLTNLSVTGALTPDVTGTNYVQIADVNGYPRWYNSDNNHYIWDCDGVALSYVIATNNGSWSEFDTIGSRIWYRHPVYAHDPIYTNYFPYAGSVTGTAAVAYWYQTNYSSVALVTVKGIATP